MQRSGHETVRADHWIRGPELAGPWQHFGVAGGVGGLETKELATVSLVKKCSERLGLRDAQVLRAVLQRPGISGRVTRLDLRYSTLLELRGRVHLVAEAEN